MTSCCICGRDLPNRYAMAGRCQEPGCENAFCALHWRTGNQHCREHGWRDGALCESADTHAMTSEEEHSAQQEETKMSTPEQNKAGESRIREWARTHLTARQARKIMQSTVDFATKAGRSAGSLVSRLRNEKSPEDMLRAIDDALESNRARRLPLAERVENLYKTIVTRRKVYESAPPSRRKILEMELRNLMAEYKGAERELETFYENEHSLNVVRGRLLELMAHGMRQLHEQTVDKLIDDIEEAVESADGVQGAVRDLDKSGRRREREGDMESFEAELAGFGELPEEEMPEITEVPQPTETEPVAQPEEEEGLGVGD